jgi:hypothetical protein
MRVAKRQSARESDQPELAFTTKKTSTPSEETARKAVAKRPTTPSGRVNSPLPSPSRVTWQKD